VEIGRAADGGFGEAGPTREQMHSRADAEEDDSPKGEAGVSFGSRVTARR